MQNNITKTEKNLMKANIDSYVRNNSGLPVAKAIAEADKSEIVGFKCIVDATLSLRKSVLEICGESIFKDMLDGEDIGKSYKMQISKVFKENFSSMFVYKEVGTSGRVRCDTLEIVMQIAFSKHTNKLLSNNDTTKEAVSKLTNALAKKKYSINKTSLKKFANGKVITKNTNNNDKPINITYDMVYNWFSNLESKDQQDVINRINQLMQTKKVA